MNIPIHWINKLKAREEENALRALSFPFLGIDFYSNDYLGMARSVSLREKASAILANYHCKNGSTGSRLIAGNTYLAMDAEAYLARFYQAEKALLYNSGYSANVGLMSCLAERNDTILYDALVHASIRDGMRMSFAKQHAFAHNNLEELQSKLQKATGTRFVVTESIFSMDGDMAPLHEMLEVCQKYNAFCVVDEAHAVGIYERGLSAGLENHPNLLARVVTFGKAMGVHGAAIVGSEKLQQYLINFSRAFIYTTAPSDSAIAEIWASHEQILTAQEARVQLAENIRYFREKASLADLAIGHSHTPIQYIVVAGNERTKNWEKTLSKHGIHCKAILSPTVPEGKERLRITLHSYNSPQEIDLLVEKLLICKSAL